MRRMLNPPPFNQPKQTPRHAVANALPEERKVFLRKTYLHLALAVLLLTGLEALLLRSPLTTWYVNITGQAKDSGLWLPILLAFMFVSRFAKRYARKVLPIGQQYAYLAGFIVIKALLLLPLIWHANQAAPMTIMSSAIISLALFSGLTLFAFLSGVDFSFLRGVVWVGSFVLIGIFIARWLLGFQLGWVAAALVFGYATITLLYRTSEIMQQYRVEQYAVAALALFASVTMLFASVLRMQNRLGRQ
ncbi:MAG: Bax inhibitor-1 family protein [Deinococcales bacterium]